MAEKFHRELFEKCFFLCKKAGLFHLFALKNHSYVCEVAGKIHGECFQQCSFLCKMAGTLQGD